MRWNHGGVGLFLLLSILSVAPACQMLPDFLVGDPVNHTIIESSERVPFEGWPRTLEFYHGGRTLLIGGCLSVFGGVSGEDPCASGLVQTWDLNENKFQKTQLFPRAVTAIAVSPDGTRWVAGDVEGRLILSTASRIPKPVGQKEMVTSLVFSFDGKWVAIGRVDPKVGLGVLDVATGGVIKLKRQFGAISSLAFSLESKELAVGMASGGLVVWDYIANPRPIEVVSQSSERYAITSTSFSRDGSLLTYGRQDGKLVILNWATGETVVEFKGWSPITAVAFSPDGRYLAVGQENGKVVLLEPQTGREVWSKRHILPVLDLAYSPDGTSMAVAAERVVYLYRLFRIDAEGPPIFDPNVPQSPLN